MVTGQDQPITVKEGQFKLSLRPVEGQGAEIFIPKGGPDPKGAGLLLDSRDRKIQLKLENRRIWRAPGGLAQSGGVQKSFGNSILFL